MQEVTPKYKTWNEYYKERSGRAKKQFKRLQKADKGLLARQAVNYILILNLLAVLGHAALTLFPDSLLNYFSGSTTVQYVIDAVAGVSLAKAIKSALTYLRFKPSEIVSINDVFAFGRRLTNKIFVGLLSINLVVFFLTDLIDYLKTFYGKAGKSNSHN